MNADDITDLAEARRYIKSLAARVAELSEALKLPAMAQREWLHAQRSGDEVPELAGLTAGRRVKLTCAVLVEAYRTWQRGVPPYRIAKTLLVDHRCIAKFVAGEYGSREALMAYEKLGITPKWLRATGPGAPGGPAEGQKGSYTQLKPNRVVPT
jgi:hypothetical protein